MIEESVALPRVREAARDLRRRALLRRLPRSTPATRSRRCARPCAAAPKRSCCATPTAAACPGTSKRVVRDVSAPSSQHRARHPRPRRHRLRRRQQRWPPCARGARHVQGTINGYGERCGNANLCVDHPEPRAQARLPLPRAGPPRASSRELSRFVAEVANLAPDAHMAYVGQERLRAQGRRARRGHAPSRRLVPARRSRRSSATRCASS